MPTQRSSRWMVSVQIAVFAVIKVSCHNVSSLDKFDELDEIDVVCMLSLLDFLVLELGIAALQLHHAFDELIQEDCQQDCTLPIQRTHPRWSQLVSSCNCKVF